MSALDLEGLKVYDAKIKAYISDQLPSIVKTPEELYSRETSAGATAIYEGTETIDGVAYCIFSVSAVTSTVALHQIDVDNYRYVLTYWGDYPALKIRKGTDGTLATTKFLVSGRAYPGNFSFDTAHQYFTIYKKAKLTVEGVAVMTPPSADIIT